MLLLSMSIHTQVYLQITHILIRKSLSPLKYIILHFILAEIDEKLQPGISVEPSLPTAIQHITNTNKVVVTARIESAERNELLNQLIKEKVTTVHNGLLCLLCGKVIRQSSNIRRHFRDRHLHEGVHYNCPQCQKTYKSRNTFSSHMSMMHKDWGRVNLHNFAIPASEF